MTDQPRHHVIADPYPESIGVTALTIWVPEDFRGDGEVSWWYPGKSNDEDKQRITCSASTESHGKSFPKDVLPKLPKDVS